MIRPFAFSLFATLLMLSVAVFAQTPMGVKASPRSVSIQVAFVAVSISDLDALGVNFNLLPLPSPRSNNQDGAASQAQDFLEFATGNIVPQIYQTLTRASDKVIVDAPVIAADNSALTFAVDTALPAFKSPAVIESDSLFPQLTGSLKVQGKLTLIPHINSDNSISLDLLSPLKGNKKIRLRQVLSGQQIVICASIIEKQVSNGRQHQPSITGTPQTRFVRDNAPELLIFITPTILPDASTPPLSAPPSASISVKPADFTEHSIMLNHVAASDILKLMHWDESDKAGSNSKMPEGVDRISAAPGNNSLLVQATPEGYSQIKNITEILDVGRFEWTMKMQCWTANVQEKDLAGLVFEKRSYVDQVIRTPGDKQYQFVTKPMEVASGSAAESLLQRLLAAKRTIVVPINYEAASTQQWSIGDMLFDSARIQSDDTAAVRWTSRSYEQWNTLVNSKMGSNLPDLAAKLVLPRNEIVILHSRTNSSQGQIMFIKAEY